MSVGHEDAAGTVRRHLLVESKGPWRGPGCERLVADATAIARAGHPVVLHLVADGVHGAVPGALPALPAALDAGVAVCADRLAVDERALRGLLDPRVVPSGPDELADELLARPNRSEDPATDLVTVWH